MKNQSPLTIIVFGATGDLYQNKLSLALFNLSSLGLLPLDFSIVGFARKPFSDLEFQNFTREAILNKNPNSNLKELESFLKKVKYMQGDLGDLASFQGLGQKLLTSDAEKSICSNKLFYLAVPPTLYRTIFQNISTAGLTLPCASGVPDTGVAWTRVLVEKPFGSDMCEAEKLDQLLGELFDESQIFRIDHYLAKETMQSILDFRFFNGEKESVYPDCTNWISIDDRSEYLRRYPYMPERLIDNLLKKEARVSVTNWDRVTSDLSKLEFLIDAAWKDRQACEYDLSRPMRRSNS